MMVFGHLIAGPLCAVMDEGPQSGNYLLRWNPARLGIRPNNFIAFAEQCGIQIDIDEEAPKSRMVQAVPGWLCRRGGGVRHNRKPVLVLN
jgi:hypothetical protein